MIDWRKYALEQAKMVDRLRKELALITKSATEQLKLIKAVQNPIRFDEFDGVLRAQTLNVLANVQYLLEAVIERNEIDETVNYTKQAQILQRMEEAE